MTWNNALRLRSVCADDKLFLKQLFMETNASYLDDFMKEIQWRAQRQSYRERFPNAIHDLLLLNEEPAGQILTSRDADSITLIDVSVQSAQQGQGLGSWMLHRLIKESNKLDLPIDAHVLQSNTGALRLYLCLGFVVQTGERSPHLTLRRHVTHDHPVTTS